jgi:hypothetical protein
MAGELASDPAYVAPRGRDEEEIVSATLVKDLFEP